MEENTDFQAAYTQHNERKYAIFKKLYIQQFKVLEIIYWDLPQP